MDKFKNRIIEEFEAYGFKFFRETIWSSSLQQLDLPRIRKFLAKNDFHHIDVALMRPGDDQTCRKSWSRHYQPSGQCMSLMREIPIPAESNHLKLTFCYANAEARHENRTQTLVVANALRLVFGVPVARELIITRFFSDDENEPEFFSDEGYASLFDVQSLNFFDAPAIEDAQLVKIPEEAVILLDKSFAQTYPIERFILMWMAFEAIVHSVVENGSNGAKREYFFKKILKSTIANDEIYRLFQIRCAVFKEGQAPNHNIENDCWSLYSALQLLIMKDCEQRSAFLSGYESSINKGR